MYFNYASNQMIETRNAIFNVPGTGILNRTVWLNNNLQYDFVAFYVYTHQRAN